MKIVTIKADNDFVPWKEIIKNNDELLYVLECLLDFKTNDSFEIEVIDNVIIDHVREPHLHYLYESDKVSIAYPFNGGSLLTKKIPVNPDWNIIKRRTK